MDNFDSIKTDTVVDARVITVTGHIHHYEGVLPIKHDLDCNLDWLFIYVPRSGSVASYKPGYWRAVETNNPRSTVGTDEPGLDKRVNEVFESPPVEKPQWRLYCDILDEQDKKIIRRMEDIEQRLTAVHIGFGELREHLEPLLEILKRPYR